MGPRVTYVAAPLPRRRPFILLLDLSVRARGSKMLPGERLFASHATQATCANKIPTLATSATLLAEQAS